MRGRDLSPRCHLPLRAGGTQASGRARPRWGDMPACFACGVHRSSQLGLKAELPSFPTGERVSLVCGF